MLLCHYLTDYSKTDFFATAKTHKFDTIEDINAKDLKLRPIVDQTRAYIYDVSKVVAQFLKPLARNEFTISDTLAFPELLKNIENSDDYEDVSYDVESLFTSIPIKETIDYIIHKIYIKNVIEPMCKKSIFKKLLRKLTKECAFSVNNRLIKQIDGCPMGGPISVVFADIYMCKMEDDVVAPLKPIFYKYVDDTYVRRKKNATDELFEKLNTYHDNIKLTIEENPTKFLDTEIVRHNSAIITKVYTRSNKFPIDWSSKIPLRYKCNTITGDLHTTNKYASNFSNETRRTKTKYLQAGFLFHVINDNENDNHEFKWSVLSLAPKVSFKSKILEPCFIKTLNPIFNNQLNSDILTLFRNGVA